MFILLAATVLIGAVYPLLRPWQNLMTNTQTIPYANIVQDSGFKNLSEMRDPLFDLAPQYLGRTNSAAVRWLLR
jgi:hypothetical protein